MDTDTEENARGWVLSEADNKSVGDRMAGRGLPAPNVLNVREKRCLERHRGYMCYDCSNIWGFAAASLIIMVLTVAFVVRAVLRRRQTPT